MSALVALGALAIAGAVLAYVGRTFGARPAPRRRSPLKHPRATLRAYENEVAE